MIRVVVLYIIVGIFLILASTFPDVWRVCVSGAGIVCLLLAVKARGES